MKALSSALVVCAGIYGFLNAHRTVAGPDPLGTISYVVCGTVLVIGIGGWLFCLNRDD